MNMDSKNTQTNATNKKGSNGGFYKSGVHFDTTCAPVRLGLPFYENK